MEKEADRWTNVVSYEKSEYLPVDRFLEVKEEVRQCWRSLGMLHLRMESDGEAKRTGKRIPAPEIARRLRETAARLTKAADATENRE